VYLGVFLWVAVASHAIAWVEGYVAVGAFSAYWTTNAFVFVIGFGGIHLLDRMAADAWMRFRPLTSLDDREAGRVAYALTTMPVRPVLVCVLLGIVTGVTFFVLQSDWSGAAGAGLHRARYESRRTLEPAGPRLGCPDDSGGCRLLRRAAERDPRADRRREVPPTRGRRATPRPGPRRPHLRAERGDVSDASAVNDQIASLLTEREVLSRASTWPWSPGTLRGFGTAIALPIALWLAYRVLDQLIA
jgi:hypothetical protein